MTHYIGSFSEMLQDCDINARAWQLFVSSAKSQRAEMPEPVLSPEDKHAIEKFFASCTEDVDVETLNSAHHDPDPYCIGGCYTCADNWTCDEDELTWETFKKFLDRVFCDQLYNYIDLSSPELEDEEALASAASLEAIEYIWDNCFNDTGKNPLF